MIAVEKLTAPSGQFNDVSFSVRKGEIFGIAGLVGSGRTELVRAIAGADYGVRRPDAAVDSGRQQRRQEQSR